MNAANQPPKAILALDIGALVTRGFLFDIVGSSYHLTASADSFSSHLAPNFDIGEAIYHVVSRLQEVTGRVLMDPRSLLIMPVNDNSEGVDLFFITTSCAPELKIVAVGLLNEVSLESAKKLAYSVTGQLVDVLSINDRRSSALQMDAILAAKPDLIIFAGGTENGANRSLIRTADLLCGALGSLPRGGRPHVLFCGNQALAADLEYAFSRYTTIQSAPNIRPTLEKEVLEPAMMAIDAIMMEKVNHQVGGLERISTLCSTPPQLAGSSFHQVVKFLGRQYDPEKGVLALDIGTDTSLAAYANHKNSSLNVFDFGLGSGIEKLLARAEIQDITRWLTHDWQMDDVSDYLWNCSLFPQRVATTEVELEIEMAAARQLLRVMMHDLGLRGSVQSSYFEPILISGSIFGQTTSAAQALRVILDGIQPLGITPLILDKHGLLPTLGTVGAINPLLSVQLLDSPAFTNLATVVNVVSRARRGSQVMFARLTYQDGRVKETAIKQGSLISLPLPEGAQGELVLRPTRRVEVEETVFSAEPMKVRGGVCGLVIDARGRPLRLPDSKDKRIERLKEWDLIPVD